MDIQNPPEVNKGDNWVTLIEKVIQSYTGYGLLLQVA